MTPLTRYLSAVSAVGLTLLAGVAVLGGSELAHFGGAQHWIFLAGLIVGETVPMRIVHDGSEGEITTSSTFAMALLLSAGAPAAMIGLTLGAVAADALQRKPPARALFNVGQYAVSMFAAALAFTAVSGTPLLGSEPLSPRDLPACMAAAAVFFVVNAALVARAVSLAEGVEFWGYLRRDLAVQTVTVGILLGLGPIVVITANFAPVALPLLGLPLLAIRRAGREYVARTREAVADSPTRLADPAPLL